jgi:cytochrome P450
MPSFNPFLLAGHEDPFATLARARREAPVSEFAPMGIWNVLGYAECVAVLGDPAVFSSDRRISKTFDVEGAGGVVSSPGLIGLDGADHSRLRGLFRGTFAPKSIQTLESRIRQIADELIDRFALAGSIDLVADFAHPLPVIVIAGLLGIPAARQADFRRWSDALAGAADTAIVRKTQRELVAFFSAHIEERHSDRRGDLISDLLAALEAGSLTREELIAQCVLLLVAGNETTRNLISNAVLAATRFPELRASLTGDQHFVRPALEEVARYYPPVQCALRYATRDVVLAGRTIRAGQPLFVWIPAGNRDESVFPEPDRFDVARSPNRHLSFGWGVHFCLGAHLGRLEAEVAITTLLRRLPDFERADDGPLEMLPSFMAYGVKHLRLAFQPQELLGETAALPR